MQEPHPRVASHCYSLQDCLLRFLRNQRYHLQKTVDTSHRLYQMHAPNDHKIHLIKNLIATATKIISYQHSAPNNKSTDTMHTNLQKFQLSIAATDLRNRAITKRK